MYGGKMKCNLLVLERYIDNELDYLSKNKALAHINSCEKCKKWIEEQEKINELILSYSQQKNSPLEIKENIFNTLKTNKRQIKNYTQGIISKYFHIRHFAIAASAVIAFLAGILSAQTLYTPRSSAILERETLYSYLSFSDVKEVQ